MSKPSLMDQLLADPARYYRGIPMNVVRDRRLNVDNKRALLKAWAFMEPAPEVVEQLRVAALALVAPSTPDLLSAPHLERTL